MTTKKSIHNDKTRQKDEEKRKRMTKGRITTKENDITKEEDNESHKKIIRWRPLNFAQKNDTHDSIYYNAKILSLTMSQHALTMEILIIIENQLRNFQGWKTSTLKIMAPVATLQCFQGYVDNTILLIIMYLTNTWIVQLTCVTFLCCMAHDSHLMLYLTFLWN